MPQVGVLTALGLVPRDPLLLWQRICRFCCFPIFNIQLADIKLLVRILYILQKLCLSLRISFHWCPQFLNESLLSRAVDFLSLLTTNRWFVYGISESESTQFLARARPRLSPPRPFTLKFRGKKSKFPEYLCATLCLYVWVPGEQREIQT